MLHDFQFKTNSCSFPHSPRRWLVSADGRRRLVSRGLGAFAYPASVCQRAAIRCSHWNCGRARESAAKSQVASESRESKASSDARRQLRAEAETKGAGKSGFMAPRVLFAQRDLKVKLLAQSISAVSAPIANNIRPAARAGCHCS